MDFGMPALVELDTLEENCSLCSSLGLKFVEINMNFPQFQPENFDADLCSRLKEKYGIYFTIHLPEIFNPCETNSAVKKSWLSILSDTIDFAKEIQCPVINMHMNHGIYVTLPEKKLYVYEKYSDQYFKDIEEFEKLCIEKIGNQDIKISIENTDGFRDFEKTAVEKLCRDRHFSITWDIGHSASTDEKDMEFLLSNIGSIKHFHIHDGSGTTRGGKCHLALGSGDINLRSRLNLAKECGARCVVETKTAAALRASCIWLFVNKFTEGTK